MKTLQFLIIVILATITLYPNIAFADISKSVISVNDTQYDITFNTENSSINKISPNLHSYVYNSLDMNIASNKQYNGSLTLTLTKDAVANVFCITRSDVDTYLKSGSAFDVRVDNNHENFTTSTTNDKVSLTFDIPKGSQNATMVNEFVGMAVSPSVYFKGIPQTGTYSSGQDVIFNGTLVDACSRHLGVEKVYFTAEQLNVTKEVTSDDRGKFSINFTIPANTESGNYTSKIEMYQYPFAYHLSGVETLYLNVGTNNTQIVPESPLQQFKSGIKAENVKCADGFILVIKSEDGSPACVTDSGMGRMTRQGWWAWNNNVGNAIINNTGKKEFESKDCAISETMSAIVGTNGFVLDDLPVNGTIFYGADTSRMVAGVTQFAVHPGNTAQITLTYDFNPYPGSNCKVTTSDVISNVDPSRPNATISELINSPDIMKVDENSVNMSIPPLGNSGDILLNLASVENLNDHVVKATYKIFAKPDAQLGKSYYVGFWWHSAVVITVGDSLYTGHAFEGTHYG